VIDNRKLGWSGAKGKILGAGLLVIVGFMMSARGQGAPSANQIDRRAMQQVCESSATINIDAKGHFQCSVCPSYTDFHGTRESFDLQAVYRGRFSTTNTDQLLLALNGCEPHSSGFGGSILLTRDGTAWKKSGYFKGDDASKCLSFKARDGFDRLVCFAGDSHAGNSVYWTEHSHIKRIPCTRTHCSTPAGTWALALRSLITVMTRASTPLKNSHPATASVSWLHKPEVWRRPVRTHAGLPKSRWSRRRP
jgi:hypothetical protein